MTIQGHCLGCKEKKDLVNASEVTMKNGRLAVQGNCAECGRNITRMGGLKEGETL